jgi:hypothetical protein
VINREMNLISLTHVAAGLQMKIAGRTLYCSYLFKIMLAGWLGAMAILQK